jgi:hypothetical protein
MPDSTQTRYFRLDTRDTTFQPVIYYAAWRPFTYVLFVLDDNGKATVMDVRPLKSADMIRDTVQQGITDVVGFSELSERPDIQDVDISQVQGQANATTIGTILEV